MSFNSKRFKIGVANRLEATTAKIKFVATAE